MTVLEFAKNNGYEIVCDMELAEKREITGVYVCDLLSMAMARLEEGNLWVTVHTNVNIIAVASLTNVACIVIPESISIEEMTIKKSAEQGIVILRTSNTAYQICIRFFEQSGRYLK